jgi:hypothetical protein
MRRLMGIEGSPVRGKSVRATSLTTSLDPRRDGHVLDCSGRPDARSGGKEVGLRD